MLFNKNAFYCSIGLLYVTIQYILNIFLCRKMAQKDLIPMSRRSKEEVKEIARRGGINSGKVRQQQKQLKELFSIILSSPASKEQIKKIQKAFPNVEAKTIGDIVNLAMVKKAVAGDVQAYNTIADRVEGKPQQKTDITTQGEKINKIEVEIIK